MTHKNKISKKEKIYTEYINNEMLEKVNIYNKNYGKSISKGNIQTGYELIYMISNDSSNEKKYLDFYNKYMCWPDKIPPSIIVDAIIGYSRNLNELYNLIFIKNQTLIPKSIFISAMELAEFYNKKLKLTWTNSSIVSNDIYENMPEYINPEEYLSKINLKDFYNENYYQMYYKDNLNF